MTTADFPLSDCEAITIPHRMREVAIVGAGELGGLTAHALARRNAAGLIRLIDDAGRVAEGKALDISQAAGAKDSVRSSPVTDYIGGTAQGASSFSRTGPVGRSGAPRKR